uniref:CCHC-type domain-containing protein n=1 Tax=Setaria italica TaxID=4555 RepID=K3ZZD8_SETIT
MELASRDSAPPGPGASRAGAGHPRPTSSPDTPRISATQSAAGVSALRIAAGAPTAAASAPRATDGGKQAPPTPPNTPTPRQLLSPRRADDMHRTRQCCKNPSRPGCRPSWLQAAGNSPPRLPLSSLPSVFRARLSGANIANFILARGHLNFAGHVFFLHHSEARAMATAACLREEDEAVIAHHPPPGSHPDKRGARGASLPQLPPGDQMNTWDCQKPVAARDPRDQKDTFFTPSAALGLLPLPRHASPCTDVTGSGDTDRDVASEFTAPPLPPDARPYLLAARAPASFTPALARRFSKPILLHHGGCHRCLARDHQVRDCRDPIRCRLCRRFGHRGYACPMAFPREQTPHPRRRPTVPLPASRVPINAVPFLPRSSPPPSATPTPPPTPLNLPPFTTAFDPLRMLASTSSTPPVVERVLEPRRPSPEEGPFYLGDLFREPQDTGKRVAPGEPSSPQLRASRAIPKARDIRVVGAASPRRAP